MSAAGPTHSTLEHPTMTRRGFAGLLLALVAGWPTPAPALSCFNPGVAPTTPDADFEVAADGTARHLATGLVWMRCAIGQTWTGTGCSGTAMSFPQWGAALRTVRDINSGASDADNDGAPGFAGMTDWRMPNIKELVSIHEACRRTPAFNDLVFPNAPAGNVHWSSTTVANSPSVAWYMDSADGVVSFTFKSDVIPRVMRLVRAGGVGGYQLTGRIFADGFEP